jgi:hypothetical protein
MRRFRIRRRRAAALALLPAAAITMTTSLTMAAPKPRSAAIEPQRGSVTVGDKVLMRGRFPDAPNAVVSIRHQSAGHKVFKQVATTRTGPGGYYDVRVKPHSTGLWRAELAEPARVAQSQPALDGRARRVDTRSDSERIRVRSKIAAAVSKHNANLGQGVNISGRVAPRGRRAVEIRAGGKKIRTTTNKRGRFEVRWQPPSTGSFRVTAQAEGDKRAGKSADDAGRVTVYRPAAASWYGPGLYGNRTACGQTLTASTLGVAHKSMPCGTKLKLKYGSRTVRVRVIDRGPYAGNREFDLTYATKQRLGFPDVGTVYTSK